MKPSSTGVPEYVRGVDMTSACRGESRSPHGRLASRIFRRLRLAQAGLADVGEAQVRPTDDGDGVCWKVVGESGGHEVLLDMMHLGLACGWLGIGKPFALRSSRSKWL
ncbi:hypothetical protein MRS44_005469 [Fusarium solani]|jgi:hypothetical protein|uniref:uncharacterized protein n=1 Tax=Fusarium solani TaxID=169388 RepID=UPI0032C3F3A4|nr:hypothetical protein MRS44_005469 [Fusarium solani]